MDESNSNGGCEGPLKWESFPARQETRRQTKVSGLGIKNKNGRTIYDNDGILERWYKYGRCLFLSNSAGPDSQPTPTKFEADVLKEEIRAAIKKLKKKKAPDQDNITAELIKAGGDTVIEGEV